LPGGKSGDLGRAALEAPTDVAERKQSNRRWNYSDAGSDPLPGQLTYSWLVPAVKVGCITNVHGRLTDPSLPESGWFDDID
jgi:hypothetical protein